MELRPYQTAAVDAVIHAWLVQKLRNVLVDMATGTGKSLVIAEIIRRIVERFPHVRVLMLVHTQELVQQNADELRRLMPTINLGINCGNLGRHDTTQKVIFGTIQSVWNKIPLLGDRTLVLIDEAHRVPRGDNGTYSKAIAALQDRNPKTKICGLSASVYRLDSGRLDRGEDRLFDETVFTYSVAEGVTDGYLSPVVSKATQLKIDTAGVAKKAGDFVLSDLERTVDTEDVTARAVDEIVHWFRTQRRRSIMVFCCGIAHSQHVADELVRRGLRAVSISGDTPQADRARYIKWFKEGRIDAVTNCDVLTTGFNVAQVDLIAMLRPTMSTGLYVQIVGRGTRLAEGKRDCLVLDFAGNCRRHGPIDAVDPKAEKRKVGTGEKEEAGGKECPACQSVMAYNAKVCTDCGHEFVVVAPDPKHDDTADDSTPVMSSELTTEWHAIDFISYRHNTGKGGKPDTLMVKYKFGSTDVVRFVCLAHDQASGAYKVARQWWDTMGGGLPVPTDIPDPEDLYPRLALATHVMVKQDTTGRLSVDRLIVTDGKSVWLMDEWGKRRSSGFRASTREAALAIWQSRRPREEERETFGDMLHGNRWAPSRDDAEIPY